MKAALVIMAAGLGSRYGGNKQTDGVGPNGEVLMEYSVYDAVRAGFTKIVFIIKPEHLGKIKNLCGDKAASLKSADGTPVDVRYAFQELSKCPDFYTVPSDRVKPFGTAHAVLCARSEVSEPFAVINADDYYGPGAFAAIYGALCTLSPEGEGAMVGFMLKNTLSENGSVARGVCSESGGYLTDVTENLGICEGSDGVIRNENGDALSPNTLVSMNFWGFTPWIFDELENYFIDFLRSLPDGELKRECFLPSLVDERIKQGKMRVSLLETDARWFGMTYAPDREAVSQELKKLHASGVYQPKLWS